MASTPTVAGRAEKFEKLCGILDHHARRPARLIPILQAIQHEYQYLPEEVLTYVATSLGVPPARVFGVATFYAHFALEPKGKHVVRLCDGTACHVKQSLPILDALHEKLGTSEKRKTSQDMLFTVETVACLGACGLAPVVVVDDQVYGQMTPERAVALVDEIVTREAALKSTTAAPAEQLSAEAAND
jgi:NADH-quinone oxidoreductase subunit E